MNNALRMMTVVFNLPLKHSDIRLFRGAVIKAAGVNNTLFHNHDGQGFNYKYPLIQYRIIGGKAAVICLNEGVEQMQSLFASGFVGGNIVLAGENRGEVAIESIRQNEYSLKELEIPLQYHISRWLPLNQQNYNLWKHLDTQEEKESKLKSILIGNIISLAKGIGWQINSRIECSIDIESIITRPILYKDQSLISFSLNYTTNLFIPGGLGLGKGVSSNCGVISRPL